MDLSIFISLLISQQTFLGEMSVYVQKKVRLPRCFILFFQVAVSNSYRIKPP